MKNCYIIILLLLCNKLYAQQPCQWAYIPIGNNAYHAAYYTTLDNNGDVIQVGRMLGVADMDPGTLPGDTSFSPGGYGYYLSKTSVSGHLVWIRYFSQPGGGMFEFKGVRVNSANEIVVVGNFFGVVDFDLSTTGVDTIRSHFPTYPDYFIAKYDPGANHQWAFSIGNPTTNDIELKSMCIKTNDDILICANPNGLVDVDPGPAVHNSIGGNANIICYNTNGNYVWNNNIATTYSYANDCKSIDCDAAGNAYLLSVGYYELTVSKFDVSGILLWDKTIGDFSVQSRVNPQSVLVDKATGYFYIVGTFDGTVDFDPGASTVNETSSSANYDDAFMAKYDSSMNIDWLNAYPGNISFGKSAIDFSGNNVVAVGDFNGMATFGPGFTYTASQLSPFYFKVDASGNAIESYMLNANGGYRSIHSTSNQSYVIMGNLSGSADMDPTAATINLTSPSFSNDFMAVYGTVPTSFGETFILNDVKIFPNPADEVVYVESNSAGYLQLIDMSGKIVLSESISAFVKNKINTRQLGDGIYFLKTGNTIRKITVVHRCK